MPNRSDAIAEGCAPKQNIDSHSQNDRNQQADVQTGWCQTRQAIGNLQPGSLWNLRGSFSLHRIDHWTTQHEVHNLNRDCVHHNRA